LLLALGSVLMATEGQEASGVLHTYPRAHMLCAQGEEKEPLFLALRGLPIAAYARGEHGLERDLAEQYYALAQGLHERTYVVEALQLLGSTQFLLGDYPTARQHYEQWLALYHRLAPSHLPRFQPGRGDGERSRHAGVGRLTTGLSGLGAATQCRGPYVCPGTPRLLRFRHCAEFDSHPAGAKAAGRHTPD
jgi:hypothetical protein